MKKFEIGNYYSMRSACDHNCVWTYKVIARTEKTITLLDEYGKVKKCRISKWSNKEETVLPFGKYSMCPILRA